MILRTVSAALLSLPLIAHAATYTTIDQSESQIAFHYEQMGVSMSGTFTELSGQIDFDSAEPEKATATIHVSMSSADTGSEEANGEIVKKDWFNTDAHPEAVFTTTAISPQSNNEYEVTGVLSIKGHEKTVQFPATLTEANNQAVFAGSFSLLRGDYAIGEGVWSTFDIVGNDIRVDFNLVATE